jgi:hypothetical protein
MIGKSMRSDDNFGSVLHRRHTTVKLWKPDRGPERGLRGCLGRGFSRALLVARLRSHPVSAVRPWSALRRQTWPAPTASRSRPLAGWLRQALSRQARSAREETEVNETWPLVSGIAADW